MTDTPDVEDPKDKPAEEAANDSEVNDSEASDTHESEAVEAAPETQPESQSEPDPEPNSETDTKADSETDSEVDVTSESVPAKGLDPEHIRLLEALLFASDEPLTERLMKNRLPDGASVKASLKHIQKDFAQRGVNLVQRGKTWAFRTATDLTELLNKEIEVPRKMSRAGIETMAIISYHQPVTRGEIEEIRGVTISRGTIDILLELGWIGPRGRRQVPGRPMTWGTTDAFLDHFGLQSTDDLPGVEELKAAGLLDASPAIQVYRSQVNGEGEDQGVLPIEGMNEEEAEAAEPLNPEG
jgi:segregation and condensation protein B